MTIPEALDALQAARQELYEAATERRRLSLARQHQPALIVAANLRIVNARLAVAAARTAARIVIYGA